MSLEHLIFNVEADINSDEVNFLTAINSGNLGKILADQSDISHDLHFLEHIGVQNTIGHPGYSLALTIEGNEATNFTNENNFLHGGSHGFEAHAQALNTTVVGQLDVLHNAPYHS